jgi:peptidoglycan endopeptidase LytE
MRELLLLLLVAPFGLVMVLTTRLGEVAPPPTAPLVLEGQHEVAAAPAPTAAPLLSAGTDTVTAMIQQALTWLSPSVPYLWGGCTRRGVDCSCFVMNVLVTVGVHAPRVTTDQIRWAVPVSASNARPGDLVFFDNTCTNCGANPTHVGLYLGGGQVINAGDPVQINPLSHFARNNPRFGRVPGW